MLADKMPKRGSKGVSANHLPFKEITTRLSVDEMIKRLKVFIMNISMFSLFTNYIFLYRSVRIMWRN